MRNPTDADYDRIVDDLTYRYSDSCTRAEVQVEVIEARAELEANATHLEFLPILVARHAHEALLAKLRADGRLARPVPEILFVCEHNAGRSQLAAAVADRLAHGHVHVRCSGKQHSAMLNPNVVQALHEQGIDLTHHFPIGLNGDVVHAADVVVDMGCELDDMPAKRVISWDIPDPQDLSLPEVRKIRDDIAARVRALLIELGLPVTDYVRRTDVVDVTA